MEFTGVLKKYIKWKFQGLIKNNMEFPSGDQEKIMCGISRGLDFSLGPKIFGGNTMLWSFQG